jgi:cell division protein FtsN
MSTKRKKRRSGHSGGTLLGILVGLLVGLAIAVAAALYMSKSAVPFIEKVKRPPASSVEPGKAGELPDPNRALERGKGAPDDASAVATQAPVPAAPGAPTASTVPTAPAAPGAPATPAAAPGATAPPTAPPTSGSAAPADPSTEKTAYLLQAGAFKGQEDAEGMKVKLALIGFEARIVTAEVNGVTFYRVRVGPYAQIEDMNRARSRLAENGIEASVVRQR